MPVENNGSLWSDRVALRQTAKRGDYSRSTVYSILDAALYCHVGFVHDGQPVVLPMAFGRDEDTVFLHGSSGSRMLRNLRAGTPLCLSVTELTGLVLSRSALNHSVNYRSAVIYGSGRWIDGVDERKSALKVILDHVIPGRWDHIRQPSLKELRRTAVLAIPLTEAAAKIRSGPAVEEPEDVDLPYWGGEIPVRTELLDPVPDPLVPESAGVPHHVQALTAQQIIASEGRRA
jgi:nitroimidazol reductase NimA-like FMN-containing flavoprotein (pyridoxamine 5'-phosphate oxidase superfamily)